MLGCVTDGSACILVCSPWQGTRAALTAVMYHCKKFDEDLGDFRTYAGKGGALPEP